LLLLSCFTALLALLLLFTALLALLLLFYCITCFTAAFLINRCVRAAVLLFYCISCFTAAFLACMPRNSIANNNCSTAKAGETHKKNSQRESIVKKCPAMIFRLSNKHFCLLF